MYVIFFIPSPAGVLSLGFVTYLPLQLSYPLGRGNSPSFFPSFGFRLRTTNVDLFTVAPVYIDIETYYSLREEQDFRLRLRYYF